MMREIEYMFDSVYEQLAETQEHINHLYWAIGLLIITIIIQMLILMCIYTLIK